MIYNQYDANVRLLLSLPRQVQRDDLTPIV